MYDELTRRRQQDIEQEHKREEERSQQRDDRDLSPQPSQDALPVYGSNNLLNQRGIDAEVEVANFQREGNAMAGKLSAQELSDFMAQREADREAHGLGGSRPVQEPEYDNDDLSYER